MLRESAIRSKISVWPGSNFFSKLNNFVVWFEASSSIWWEFFELFEAKFACDLKRIVYVFEENQLSKAIVLRYCSYSNLTHAAPQKNPASISIHMFCYICRNIGVLIISEYSFFVGFGKFSRKRSLYSKLIRFDW